MTELPTPPASRQSSESPELQLKQSHEAESSAKALEMLDHSLERYLLLLDQHQKLQADLAKKIIFGILLPCACELYMSARSTIWR